MKAVFSGSLKDGFSIERVVSDEKAEDFVVANLANGRLSEALDIQDPATGIGSFKAEEEGSAYVVFGRGLGNGFEVFGPFFEHEDYINDFAEKNRGDDCEWEIFCC